MLFPALLDLLKNAIAPKPVGDETPHSESETVVDAPMLAETPGKPLAIQKVGAWVGRSGFSTAKVRAQTIKATTYLGLKRLDVIVNDFSAERDPQPFTTYDKGDIVEIATMANARGIDVHLLSWAMPHLVFLDGAAEQLRDLVSLTGAMSVVFDAEESWTQARKPMVYSDAAKHIGLSFGGIPLGVTGIVYTPVEKFAPLAEVCDVLIPQAYATQTSRLKPETAVALAVRRWRQHFGKNKVFVPGLAAYRQPPKGYSIEGAMRSCFAGAESIEEIDEAVFWSLGAIRQSASVTKVVRSLATQGA